MAKHTCPRCGLESRCLQGSWSDRHPRAAVAFAVPVTLFALGAVAANPWLFVPLLALAALAYIVDREHRRRAALAARAGYEHRALPAAPVQPVRPVRHRQTHSLPWQTFRLLRTEPIRTVRVNRVAHVDAVQLAGHAGAGRNAGKPGLDTLAASGTR